MYWGHFTNGEITGYGWLVAGNAENFGNEYEGWWLNGHFHGKGKFTWNDGSSYTGEWNMSVMEGKGEIKKCDGSKYIGDWL